MLTFWLPFHLRRFTVTSVWQVLTVGCCWLSPPALAAEIAVQLVTQWQADSNPLRFPNDNTAQQATGSARKQDTILANDLRLGLVVPVLSERTRLLVSSNLGDRRYDYFSQLTHQPKNLDVAFEWAVGPVVSGRLIQVYEQRLFDYLSGGLTQRDQGTLNKQIAEFSLQLTPDLALTSTLESGRFNYDLPVNLLYNREDSGRQLSLRYRPGGSGGRGSYLSLGWREASSRFPNRDALQVSSLDTGYTENEWFVEAEWAYSVKTRSNLRAGLTQRDYDTLRSQNTNLLSLLWQNVYEYSPKTRFDWQLYNRPFSIVSSDTLYLTARGMRLDVDWRATAKTRLGAFVGQERITFHNAPNAPATLGGRYEDATRFGLRAGYELTRGVRLSTDLWRERRQRFPDQADIEQTIIRFGLAYTYENISGAAQRSGMTRYTQDYAR
ncbi:hypothetical protein [Parvibium lacunae]|nr:hypothetical protein [Parvibium lacunae]